MYDFERGAKVTGSKFYFNMDALREWDLMDQMIYYHADRGYQFVIPPYLINKKTAEHAGILPRFEGDFYETKDGFLLIPTAETPLVGLHAGEILKEETLPLKYVAFSPCFRKEAGAGGKRDSGLRRVHQFHKIELFVICKPEDSERLHNEMVTHITDMIDVLFPDLEYDVVKLSDKERSPISNKTFDINLKVGDEWLEVSSISNTGDNQTKPAQIRYRPKNGKPIKCHMLNGSALALPRLVLALEAANEKPKTP